MRSALESTPSGRIEIDYCPACRGIWFDGGELEALLKQPRGNVLDFDSPLWTEGRTSIPCPRHRSERMRERGLSTARAGSLLSRLPGDVDVLNIDQCPRCHGIWLDSGELDQLCDALAGSSAAPFLIDPQAVADRPTSRWVWMFMFLTGLPVEQYHPRARSPVIVTTLIVLCVLGFLAQLGGSPDLILQYGLIPARGLAGGVLPWITHMFLHGGVAHLLGNMYFLWVFGDNVEDRLGRARFLGLYFGAGIAAGIVHCLFGGSPWMPVVGASGAISGVMAAYALLFPNARLVSLILWVVQVRWRATTFLGFWLVMQIIGAATGAPTVAWWAHIGGFAAGAAMAWRWRPGAQKDAQQELLLPPRAPVQRKPEPPAPKPPAPKPLQWD